MMLNKGKDTNPYPHSYLQKKDNKKGNAKVMGKGQLCYYPQTAEKRQKPRKKRQTKRK